MRRAALFDMDRTLVREHTARLYTRYQADLGELSLWHRLRNSFWLLQYTVGVVNAEHVAALALQDVAGKTESWMRQRCEHWFTHNIEPHITQAARDAVAAHQRMGDLCCIVTAATRYVAEPVARAFNIDHIVCTEIEQEEQAFTGRFIPPMAYGPGKVLKMQEFARQFEFELREATFYSDSITDLPLFECVGIPVAINPDQRLSRLAKRRGWRIEQWR
ncbi:MAG TPA: HAD family hydrolase [Polyangiaceae bacterium]|nr:HAD family hydrolase [Polyangiaceae bacterium]